MSPHGGKREGAGRLPAVEKKIRCNVTLAPDVLEILKTLCNGNRSAAIEFVSRQWATQQSVNPTKGILPAKRALSKPKHLSTKKGLS